MLSSFRKKLATGAVRDPATERVPASVDGDQELIRSFIDGDSSAFSEVYRLHHKTVVSQIARQVSDPAAADELAQEVFLKAHRFRTTFKPGHAFQAWLRVIARNTVFDWLRKHGGELARMGFSHADDSEGSICEEIASDAPCAESLLIRKSDRRHLRKALRSLTRMQRRVLFLSVIRQLPYSEIARILGVSVASVKCLAYRARAALSEGLALQPAMA